MRQRLLLVLTLLVVVAVIAACYDALDPRLPPVEPDYPGAARDAGHG